MPRPPTSTMPVTLALAASLMAGAATAEDFAAGRAEYLAACAACHGETGAGDGPTAAMFREPVPDLTGIAARNGGVFPTAEIVETIDGRREVRGHGNPMPVFGNRFVQEDFAEHWYSYALINSKQLARARARTRVLELVLYLQSIQQ